MSLISLIESPKETSCTTKDCDMVTGATPVTHPHLRPIPIRDLETFTILDRAVVIGLLVAKSRAHLCDLRDPLDPCNLVTCQENLFPRSGNYNLCLLLVIIIHDISLMWDCLFDMLGDVDLECISIYSFDDEMAPPLAKSTCRSS